VQVVASLINIGVDPAYLKLHATSLQSDKIICINDKTPVIIFRNETFMVDFDKNNNFSNSYLQAVQSILIFFACFVISFIKFDFFSLFKP